MTIITFICFLIIGGFLSGDALTYWCLWLSLLVIGFLYSKIYDIASTNHKWDNSKDNKTNREIGWRALSEKRRLQLVERYKQERTDFINESLHIGISEWRRNELLNELENIDSLYNLDTPPREWKYSALS